jgi:hypothetical protein
MGCDYYIVKLLTVKYLDDGDDEHSVNIELDRQRGYFYDDDLKDSDDTDDETSSEYFDKLYEKYLKVTYEPRVLFSNHKWKNINVEEKYDEMIRDEINNGLLVSVIKKEERYLR